MSSEKLYVVYDGQCNLCLASVAKLKELPTHAALQFVQIQQIGLEGDSPLIVPGLHQVNREALYDKMHVADEQGRLFAGADGVIRILRTVKGLRWLSAFYKLPGMKRLADWMYRYIANRRYDWFGSTGQSCSINGCVRSPDRGENNKHGHQKVD
jgi:predicted DCC family thiol-disulfide oxidoreductase YuxK